jgi:diguanylate cyclase (GGDEF)-like protein
MKSNGVDAPARSPSWWLRLRSWIRYGTSLRAKLVVLVLAIAVLVVGALYGFSFVSLRASITAIYEQRARSVASVISKSIQEKDYIHYYSDELDADIDRLLERYESVVGISAVGVSARGFLVVASTDPTTVGALATEAERERFETLHGVEIVSVEIGGTLYLRAYHPLFSGPDLIGVVVVDMSLAEQARYVSRLSLQFGVGTAIGSIVLGGLLYLVLSALVTRPVGRLAGAMEAVSDRKYDVEVAVPFRRIPGTRQRDEVSRLVDGFNLMTKVIHSHEQELMKLVVLDELTGAYTLDHLRAELDRELNKTRRYKHPTSVLVIEVGDLESRTEEERDRALVRTAGFLVGNLRNVDVLYRVAESRFASLLPETPPSGAAVAAERLRGLVPDVASQLEFPVTISIAHVGWSEEGAPPVDDVLGQVLGPLGNLLG